MSVKWSKYRAPSSPLKEMVPGERAVQEICCRYRKACDWSGGGWGENTRHTTPLGNCRHQAKLLRFVTSSVERLHAPPEALLRPTTTTTCPKPRYSVASFCRKRTIPQTIARTPLSPGDAAANQAGPEPVWLGDDRLPVRVRTMSSRQSVCADAQGGLWSCKCRPCFSTSPG